MRRGRDEGQGMQRRRAVIAALGVAFGLAVAVQGDPFVPCVHARPGDAGLRVLVEATHRNAANTRSVQRALGLPETPLVGTPADVDEVAFCRCLHRRRSAALGEELARAMAWLEPSETERYQRWLFGLSPQRQREHTAFLFTSEALCFNESQPSR